jgi:ribosomal protein S18 acetylase RimI-like enzyme
MAVELDSPPPEPVWAGGFEVSTFRSGEEETLRAVIEEAFAEHWGHEERDLDHWLQHTFGAPWWDPSLVYLVREGDEVVAAEVNAVRFGGGWIGTIGTLEPWRGRGLGRALLLEAFGEFHRRGEPRVSLAVDAGNETGATQLYESIGMRAVWQADVYETRLRAKCPDCKTNTAVAIGPEYECHACGRTFAAGLVRVPRAWGHTLDRGAGMVEAATELALPYPDAAVVAEDTLADQVLVLASELPERPLILGGCCCSHIGAVEGLATRYQRLAVVWIDAHGDLNTPESSPSGNEWGMPLRMILEGGAVAPDDVALLGARDLDPGEVEFIESSGLHTGGDAVERALDGAEAVYVAIDGDGLDPGEVASWMPVPGGLSVAETVDQLSRVAAGSTVAGAGLSGFLADPKNVGPATRLCAAVGL